MDKIIQRTSTALLLAITLSVAGQPKHSFNGGYSGKQADNIAFPIGGMGAGMFCLEGTGAISHFSIYNAPDVFNEPPLFAALSDGRQAKVLEGPVPDRKKFGMPNSAQGVYYTTWGLPRFSRSLSFRARFPFAEIGLRDAQWPVQVAITGWSPFIPTDQDNSGLPAGALEYSFTNGTDKPLKYVFSYSAKRFNGFREIGAVDGGFVFYKGDTAFAVFTDAADAKVDHYWYRGSWVDPMTVAWRKIKAGVVREAAPQPGGSGATISVPLLLKAGETRTIRVFFCWYVPASNLRFMGEEAVGLDSAALDDPRGGYYKPWYCSRFKGIAAVIDYWRQRYSILKRSTELFTKAFYKSSLPPEVTEAVAANLCILKSPTVLRQYDGRLWAWEGCEDREGSCPGSCTHVWNYAQALCHLFPAMERSLRETEFYEDQDSSGHQMFRAALPIRPAKNIFAAAADGQLGGIMKVYRDWRISGDSLWLRRLYPFVKESLDYCIRTWDPRHRGVIEEPHHNTYDIELWGPEPMCTGMYLGALEAFVRISAYLGEEDGAYAALYTKGKFFVEHQLFNGEYFQQHIQWTGLDAQDPVSASKQSLPLVRYSPDDIAILQVEGPKYQYGAGCLSDGMIGAWMADVCGLSSPLDESKVRSHLQSVYTYNFKKDLFLHSNPQRVTYAIGHEGGVLLCSWPKGHQLTLPFTHSEEVWTGIEYEVASHLIFKGKVKEGLEIVRAVRRRYDGGARNPFDEYECGHWYARAMSSYALIQALTGVRYDAVSGTLYVNSKVGDFTSFLATESGFGNVVYKGGKVRVEVVYGKIEVRRIRIGGDALANP